MESNDLTEVVLIENENDESSDDDSNDDEVPEAELLAKVHDLEVKISQNEYDYNSHVELINTLQKLMDLDNLREARKKMSKLFPLTSTLWMDWLKDEIGIATTKEEKIEITRLFELAIQDYLSVDVWLEFVQFNIGLHADSEDPTTNFEPIRNLFERALTNAGLHATKGSLLWMAYTEFEMTVLMLLRGTNDNEVHSTQVKRIANIFQRQLSVPLSDLHETYETAINWLKDNLVDEVNLKQFEKAYQDSKKKLEEIEAFEKKLLNEPEEFSEYLEYEKSKKGTPVRVLCLYERILADNCLNDKLWLDYVSYVDKVIHNGPKAIDVVKRAIRNCPWNAQISIAYIRLLEKYNFSHEEITGAMEQSLLLGFYVTTDVRDIWMAYLEYMRRRMDEDNISKEQENQRLVELQKAFEKSIEHLNQLIDADPEQLVFQFWSRVEASYAKNIQKCRDLWSDILSDSHRRTAAMFLEYISLEKMYGDSKHLRKLYLKALQQTHDWPESIFASWLNFERDEGTLEDYEYCVERCKARIKHIQEKREKNVQEEEQKIEKIVRRKSKPELIGKWDNLGKKIPVKRKIENNSTEEGSTKKVTKLEKTEDIVKSLFEKPKSEVHGETIKHDSSKDNRTIFISNLDYSVSEETIQKNFESLGKITDIRLVRDFKGRSKGFCYIEFETMEAALEALKMDRKLINDRPMYVSRCDPDKETRIKNFRFSTSLEKNKLFIKGLNTSTTAENIKELFEKYGTIKDVRLVTYRNGHSKGMAYLEYEDEFSASEAINKTNGTVLQDKTISVVLSNPPERKTANSNNLKPVGSLGGGSRGQIGSRRIQISFVPRSLQMTKNAEDTSTLKNLTIHSPSDMQS